MFYRILLCALPLLGQAQLLSLTVCGDNSCSKSCVKWTAESGKCSTCDTSKGVCSTVNPSSITTSTTITFYSDAGCSPANVIPGYANIGIRLNNDCNALVASGVTVGSYKGVDISLSIGISFAVVITFILFSVCCCWRFKCCCFRPTTDTATATAGQYEYPPPPPPQVYALPSDSNYGNSTVVYPQQNMGLAVAYPYGGQAYGSQTQAYGSQTQAYGPQTQAYGPQTQAYGPQTQAYGSQTHAYSGQPYGSDLNHNVTVAYANTGVNNTYPYQNQNVTYVQPKYI